MELSVTQWMKELEALTRKSADGMTRAEIERASGRGKVTVSKLLNIAKQHGCLRIGMAYRESIHGRMQQVPVYSVQLPKDQKPKGNKGAKNARRTHSRSGGAVSRTR